MILSWEKGIKNSTESPSISQLRLGDYTQGYIIFASLLEYSSQNLPTRTLRYLLDKHNTTS